MTRRERMLPATSIAKHSRVFSLITVRHLICCAWKQASNTKTYAHMVLISLALHPSQIWFIAFGAHRATPQAGPRDLDELAGAPLRQAALSQELIERRVLGLELPQPLRLARLHAAELGSPRTEGRVAEAVLPA